MSTKTEFFKILTKPCDYHNLIIYIYCSAAEYSVDRNSAEYKFLWISWNTEFYNNMEFLQWKSCSVRNFRNQNFLDTRIWLPEFCNIVKLNLVFEILSTSWMNFSCCFCVFSTPIQYTGIGRSNGKETIFVVLLQIVWGISNLVFTVYASCFKIVN